MIYDSKVLGRKLVSNNYLNTLLAVLLVTLLAGHGQNLTNSTNAFSYAIGYRDYLTHDLSALGLDVTLPVFPAYFLTLSYIAMGIGFIRFFLQPFNSGLCIMFIDIHKDIPADIHTVFTDTMSRNYLRYLGGYLWEHLFISLWSLLLWVPGIIKHYAYSMNRYIIAEYKTVSVIRALDISKRMTRGYKMELFFFDLSFIGWFLLSIITFGLLDLLYVRPYYLASKAALYMKIKEDALSKRRVSYYDLKVPEPTDVVQPVHQSIAIENISGSLH